MEEGGVTSTALAKRLDLVPSAVSRWRNGKVRPDHLYRLVIERMFGIPALEWLTAEEQSVVARAKPFDAAA